MDLAAIPRRPTAQKATPTTIRNRLPIRQIIPPRKALRPPQNDPTEPTIQTILKRPTILNEIIHHPTHHATKLTANQPPPPTTHHAMRLILTHQQHHLLRPHVRTVKDHLNLLIPIMISAHPARPKHNRITPIKPSLSSPRRMHPPGKISKIITNPRTVPPTPSKRQPIQSKNVNPVLKPLPLNRNSMIAKMNQPSLPRKQTTLQIHMHPSRSVLNRIKRTRQQILNLLTAQRTLNRLQRPNVILLQRPLQSRLIHPKLLHKLRRPQQTTTQRKTIHVPRPKIIPQRHVLTTINLRNQRKPHDLSLKTPKPIELNHDK